MEGKKNDQGKLRMDLVPPDVIEAMATILTDGVEVYGERNWEKGMKWSRPYAALLRHVCAWWQGEDTDPDSGRPHLWHALCCISFLVAYERRDVGVDDRPGKDNKTIKEKVADYVNARSKIAQTGVDACCLGGDDD